MKLGRDQDGDHGRGDGHGNGHGRTRRNLVWLIAGVIGAVAVAIGFSRLTSVGVRLEEKLLKIRFDIAHREVKPHLAVLEVGNQVTAGELARVVDTALRARAVAVGMLVPLAKVGPGKAPPPAVQGASAPTAPTPSVAPPSGAPPSVAPSPEAPAPVGGAAGAISTAIGTRAAANSADPTAGAQKPNNGAGPAQAAPAPTQVVVDEMDELAVALRRSSHLVVAIDMHGERAELPPGRLAAGVPLAFREMDFAEKGPLAWRLERFISGKSAWAMSAQLAALAAGASPISETKKGEGISFGRLPAEGPTGAPVIDALTTVRPDIAGRVVLIANSRTEAEPTVRMLGALLRTSPPVKWSLFDAWLIVGLAVLGALIGYGASGRFAIAAAPLLLAGLTALLMDQAGRGRFPWMIAPAISLVVSSTILGLRRQSHFIMGQRRIRAGLLPQTSREMAIDLAAEPNVLAPHGTRLAVLVARMQDHERGTGTAESTLERLGHHEASILSVAKRLGGIVSHFGGDEVVVLFGLGGQNDPVAVRDRAALLASRAGLEMRAISQSRAVIGIDLGSVYCGVYGPEGRLRAHGEAVAVARDLALVAAEEGKGVLMTGRAFEEVAQRMQGRALGEGDGNRHLGEHPLFVLEGERPPTGTIL